MDYTSRGIEVKETATGFRIQVRRGLANEVSRLWPERPPRYSRALLETLALIAYRQPITRAEIEAVRGVAVNPNIIKTMLERNWVRVVGTRDVPGRPELLGTTKEFLDYFGLRSLEDLPPLAELKAMGEINLQLDLAKPGGAVGLGRRVGRWRGRGEWREWRRLRRHRRRWRAMPSRRLPAVAAVVTIGAAAEGAIASDECAAEACRRRERIDREHWPAARAAASGVSRQVANRPARMLASQVSVSCELDEANALSEAGQRVETQ